MFIQCSIMSMCSEIVDIRGELISQLNDGIWSANDILDEIEQRYGEYDGDIDFDKYLSVDEESIKFDMVEPIDYCHYCLYFLVDCDFDIERFAQDNGLIAREGVEEEVDGREDR